MKYSGKIEEINQIIVSDPSYAKEVWCRYEKDNLNAHNWDVEIQVSDYNEKIDGYSLEGIEFQVLLSHPDTHCKLTDEGFMHPESAKINEYTIGMDTACISFGINEVADRIRCEKDEWQPSTCIKTLTDGQFGAVYEGENPKTNDVNFIVISGYFNDDTGITCDKLIEYLSENFEIKCLTPEQSDSQEQSDMTIGGIQ